MQSYLDSPLYRAMLEKTMQGAPASQYPGQAIGNLGAQLLNAYALKKYSQKGEAKEADYAKALQDASAPVVDPSVLQDQIDTQTPGTLENQPKTASPDVNTMYSRILQSGNADVIKDFAPQFIKSQMDQAAKANEPITPFQKAGLARQDKIDDPAYLAQRAAAERAPASYAGEVAGAQAQATQTYDLAKIGAQQQFTAEQNQANRDNARDVAGIRAGSTGSNVQSVQPLGDGHLLKVYRDGRTELTMLDGTPVNGSRNDPKALFDQSAATAGGKAAGTAAEALPTVTSNFENILGTLDSFNDPKVKAQAKYGVGYGGFLPTIPGVNSDFNARAGQLKGQAFLQAFNTLRGGGAITEAEGSKATDSIARLSKAQTEDEFYAALGDARKTMTALYASAKQRAERGQTVPQLQGGAAPQAAPGTSGRFKIEQVQ